MSDYIANSNAQFLDSIPADDYARTDIDETFEKNVTINNKQFFSSSGANYNQFATSNTFRIQDGDNTHFSIGGGTTVITNNVDFFQNDWSGQKPLPNMKLDFLDDYTNFKCLFDSTDFASAIEFYHPGSGQIDVLFPSTVNQILRTNPSTGNKYEIAPQPLGSSDSPTFGGLTVNGPKADIAKITDEDASTNTETNVTLGFYGNGTQIARVGPKTSTDDNTYLTNEIGGDIILETTGNVGVGTTSPSESFDVNGVAKVNKLSFYGGSFLEDVSGETYVEDSAGNRTQLSSHDKNGRYAVFHHDKSGRDVEIHVEQMAEFIDTVFGTHFYQVNQDHVTPAEANFIGRFIIYLIGWLKCFKQPTRV